MTNIVTRHQQLMMVENEVAEKQAIIDQCFADLYKLKEKTHELMDKATKAINERDKLLSRIESEGLWADDYASAEDYFDEKGFSRQRRKQIRDRVNLIQVVNSVDSSLPPISDLTARRLSTLPSDDLIVTVYRVATQEAGGDPPPVRLVELLVGAARDGVNVTDQQAVRMYEEQVMIDQVISIWSQLSAGGRAQLWAHIQKEVENATISG